MEIAYYCMSNESHIFRGKNLDAIRCPYCDGLVNIKPVPDEVYSKLPKYREIMKGKKNMQSKEIDCLITYIKELENLLSLRGEELPSSREDIINLLKDDSK